MNLTQTLVNVLKNNKNQLERNKLELESIQSFVQSGRVVLEFKGKEGLEKLEMSISICDLKDVTELETHKFSVFTSFSLGISGSGFGGGYEAEKLITVINNDIDWVLKKVLDSNLANEFTSILESQFKEEVNYE